MYFSTSGPDEAPVVLLLHGGGVAGWMWDSLRASLEPRYRVLVPDLPGHGRSADADYTSHTDAVAALHQSLVTLGASRVAVVGFSFGAQLAVHLASRHPELIDRVMVVSAQAKPLPFTALTLWTLGVAAPLARNRRFARLQARELFVPAHLMDDYLDTSARITKATLLAAVGENLRFRMPAAWPAFPGPTVVMVGSRERAVMRDSAALLHGARQGSVLEVVDGCGHGVPLQRPEWFNDRVATWLAGL